jgi:hypothetical protein
MIELAIGSLITLISLLIGFSLGKYQQLIPEEAKKALIENLKEITQKRVSDVGPVPRPTQKDLNMWNNPKLAEEQRVMEQEFKNLNG